MNTLPDIGHKIVSPQTYSCNLCAITHSTFSMRGEWKNFVAGLEVSVEFLQRDQLEKQYGIRDVGLPAGFRKNNGTQEAWVTREEINRCRALGDLERLIKNPVAGAGLKQLLPLSRQYPSDNYCLKI